MLCVVLLIRKADLGDCPLPGREPLWDWRPGQARRNKPAPVTTRYSRDRFSAAKKYLAPGWMRNRPCDLGGRLVLPMQSIGCPAIQVKALKQRVVVCLNGLVSLPCDRTNGPRPNRRKGGTRAPRIVCATS